MKAVVTYPALVVLPIVSFFSFAKIKDSVSQPTLGLALSWKWTFVNMLMSLTVTTVLHMHELAQLNQRLLYMSVTESVDPGVALRGWDEATYLMDWSKDVLICTFLTALLFWRQQPVFGVLLPELVHEPHVMRQGQVEPVAISSPAKYSRQGGL